MIYYDITFTNANGQHVVVEGITAEYVELYRALPGITDFAVIAP